MGVTTSGREGSFPASLQNCMRTRCLLHLHPPTHFLLNLGLLGRDAGPAGASFGEVEAGEIGQSFLRTEFSALCGSSCALQGWA